jgi:molecular chaperone GrpE
MTDETINSTANDLGAVDDVVEANEVEGVVDPLVAERDAALAQRDEYKDIALRLQADFENYRKRAAAQMADEVDRASGKIAEALLPVLDACEAAFGHGVEGVEPVWSALIGALQKQGLEALDLQGKVFDPELAEAVMHEPADEAGAETVVVEVLRTGYRWKGRVLRAAMVKVKG